MTLLPASTFKVLDPVIAVLPTIDNYRRRHVVPLTCMAAAAGEGKAGKASPVHENCTVDDPVTLRASVSADPGRA